tara:strand:+ start:3906 stop:4370 length:465 start_codon:yes stop_codon:yes gene_type:complete
MKTTLTIEFADAAELALVVARITGTTIAVSSPSAVSVEEVAPVEDVAPPEKPKRRGRPAGAKNKPKDTPAPEPTEAAEDLAPDDDPMAALGIPAPEAPAAEVMSDKAFTDAIQSACQTGPEGITKVQAAFKLVGATSLSLVKPEDRAAVVKELS